MELTILWCGFLGSWLLVAGPILQAALELREQDLARDKIDEARKKLRNHASVSAWWWLLPPVKIILEQRSQRDFQAEFSKSLTSIELENLVTFMNKARGWWFVAGGAFFIALKETYELAHELNWQTWIYWVVVVALLIASLLNTVLILRQVQSMKKKPRS